MVKRAPDGSGWVVAAEAEVRAVLTDERFSVLEVGPATDPGTVAWLRASVSRFVNGPAHAQRRALAVAELARVHPDRLGAAARNEARRAVGRRHWDGSPTALGAVARHAPAAALARLLGAENPAAVADAVIDCAAGYFPGAEFETERRADAATARLLELFACAPAEVAVARIGLLVQGCEATATLIRTALERDLDLEQVLRRFPPVPTMRRVASACVPIGGELARTGDSVACDIVAASDPGTLSFGAGIRPCPGEAHARAAAAGVIEAVREVTG